MNVHSLLDINFVTNTLTLKIFENIYLILTLATETEIKKWIMKQKNTSSDLDLFPTSLLKECLNLLIEPVTSISNKSFQEGVFSGPVKKYILDLS